MVTPKVTFLIDFDGQSFTDGRWIVYDFDAYPNPMLLEHALSDHNTFDGATAEANRIRLYQYSHGKAERRCSMGDSNV